MPILESSQSLKWMMKTDLEEKKEELQRLFAAALLFMRKSVPLVRKENFLKLRKECIIFFHLFHR